MLTLLLIVADSPLNGLRSRDVPPERTIIGMVLAHQGGWDEMLLVLAPLLLIAGLLFIANRRANRVAEAHRRHISPPDE
jgi:hypothetical protein